MSQTYAIIQDGKIVSGGMKCSVCGEPTLSMSLADPFGKRPDFEPRCSKHSSQVTIFDNTSSTVDIID